MNKFRVAISRLRFVEKPEDVDWEKLNTSFINMELDIMRFCNAIYRGHPFCPWIHERRSVENFVAGQVIGVDIDTGDERATIANLRQHPLVRAYGGIIYETPSHHWRSPRARVLFILDQPIETAPGFKAAIKVVTDLFDDPDPSCVDAVRFFYGNGKLSEAQKPGGIWYDPNGCLPLSELRRYARIANEKERREQYRPKLQQSMSDGDTFDPQRLVESVITKAADGKRNALGFWLACTLAENGLDRGTAEDYMRQYQQAVTRLGNAAYTEHEALASVNSAYRKVAA